MERASPPHFWAENIRHAHIEPCSRDRQNMPYILHLFRFQSSHDLILMTVEFNSHVAEAGINSANCKVPYFSPNFIRNCLD